MTYDFLLMPKAGQQELEGIPLVRDSDERDTRNFWDLPDSGL